MIQYRNAHHTSLRSQRGYTVIIVLLVLTILAILAITLSYTTRLEVVSASNFTSGIQARTSAVTGVAGMSAKLAPYNSVEAPLAATSRNFWAAPRTTALNAEAVHRDSGERARRQFDVTVPPISDLYTEDTSARLNLNTATQAQMIRVFEAALDKNGLPYNQAPQLARALANWRLGPDGRPGRAGVDDDGDAGLVSLDNLSRRSLRITDNTSNLHSKRIVPPQPNRTGGLNWGDLFDNDGDGQIDEPGEHIDEPDEYIADIRREAYGDDKRVFVLSDLNYVPGFTPEIIEAIAPYVTVFSESKDIYIDRSNKERPRLNVNYATVTEIYEALLEQFPDKDPELIAQFSLNIVDYRDADSIPTTHRFNLNGRDVTLFGFEVTPFINEVWPDSSSSDDVEDDDGQYVEIINPWPVPLDVEGWRLKTANSDVVLKGQIAPHGFLIITDDLDDATDPMPEDDPERQFGSFYRIFGIVPDGNKFRMVENSAFDLPNDNDIVKLYDARGNLIDQFEYEVQGSEQYKYSWQREDPRLRVSRLEPCTPYMISKGFSKYMAEFETDARRDRLFHSMAHLLGVSASYVRREPGEREYPQAGRFPLFETTSSSGHLDLALLDIFTTESGWPDPAADREAQLTPLADNRPGDAPHPASLMGRININTVSPEMLQYLFQIDVERLLVPVQDSDQQRLGREYPYKSQVLTGDLQSTARNHLKRAAFDNRSEFLALALKPEISRDPNRREIIDAMAKLLPQITLNSMSYSVLSQNRMVVDPSSERMQARSLIQAIVSLDDDGQMQLINWHFMH